MGTDTRPAPPSSRPSDGGLVSKAARYQARQARCHPWSAPVRRTRLQHTPQLPLERDMRSASSISPNPPVICGRSYNEQRGQNSWLSSVCCVMQPSNGPSTSLDLSTLLLSSPSLLDLPCISLVEIFIPLVILFLTLRCRSFHVFPSPGQHQHRQKVNSDRLATPLLPPLHDLQTILLFSTFFETCCRLLFHLND